MSLNNVLPSWVFVLGCKKENLSPEDFNQWLRSEDGRIVPEHVRNHLLMDRSSQKIIPEGG